MDAPLLSLAGIGMTYNRAAGSMATRALQDVHVELRRGDVVGLVGKNGAGKSTLLEICLGALEQSDGAIEWFGCETLARSARRDLAYVPDIPRFPSDLTGREMLALHGALQGMLPRQVESRIAELASRLSLRDELDQRLATRSRGTIQRIALLQAIIARPAVLLCDEVFATLDPYHQAEARHLLRGLADDGLGILVSSHQLAQLPDLVNDLLILHEGRVVRRLHGVILRAQRLLIIHCSAQGNAGRTSVLEEFPGSWYEGDRVYVPRLADQRDDGSIEARLRSAGYLIHEVESRAFSLEQAFLEAIR